MIVSLCQVAEKLREKNQELYMVFVDLTKAFDTVNREALWEVPRKLGIPNSMLSVLISFHQSTKGAVVSGGKVSELFGVSSGTKQVCVMAPVLFPLYFSVMPQSAYAGFTGGVQFQFRTSGGIFNHHHFKAKTQVHSSVIHDLLFADNAALVVGSSRGCESLLECL